MKISAIACMLLVTPIFSLGQCGSRITGEDLTCDCNGEIFPVEICAGGGTACYNVFPGRPCGDGCYIAYGTSGCIKAAPASTTDSKAGLEGSIPTCGGRPLSRSTGWWTRLERDQVTLNILKKVD